MKDATAYKIIRMNRHDGQVPTCQRSRPYDALAETRLSTNRSLFHIGIVNGENQGINNRSLLNAR